jgi:hypothetical protein
MKSAFSTELLVIMLLLDGVLAAYLVWLWREKKSQFPSAQFRYRITDLWALVVALSPSLIFFAREMNASRDSGLGLWIVYIALLLPHQLGGVLLMKVDPFTKSDMVERSAWSSAVQVVVGGWLGLILPILSSFLLFLLFATLALIPVLAPILFVTKMAEIRERKKNAMRVEPSHSNPKTPQNDKPEGSY